MTIGTLTPNPKFQGFDVNGDPLSGGKLYTYTTGTSTPKSTYPTKADAEAGTNANANPVVMDSRGEANVWCTSDALYRFTLTTSADAAVWGPIDGVGSILFASGGSALVGFIAAGAGAVATTVQARIRRAVVDVEDFGDNTTPGTTDMTAAIVAAMAALPSAGGTLDYKGAVLYSSALSVVKKIRFRADGSRGTSSTDLPTSYFKKSAALNAAGITVSGNGQGAVFDGGGNIGVAGNGLDGLVILAGRVVVDDYMVALMGQDGIRIGKDIAGTNSNLFYLGKVMLKNNVRHGLYIHDTPDRNANAGVIIGHDVQSNGGDGILEGTAYGNTYIGGASQSNTGVGLHFAATADNFTVIGGDYEGNTGNNITIESGANSGALVYPHTNDSWVKFSNAGTDIALHLFPQLITWSTPQILSAGGGAATYGTQSGNYTRVGNQIVGSALVQAATLGTLASGQVELSLPVAAASAAAPTVTFPVDVFFGLGTNWISLVATVSPGNPFATVAGIQAAAGENNATLSISDLGGTSLFRYTFRYVAKT